MATIHSLENYPGTPGVNGLELAKTMQKQAETFGAEVILASVSRIDGGPSKFTIFTVPDSKYETKAVIIATGAKPRRLEAKGIREFTGRGVSYCATCDGFFYSGRDVVVIGGGNSALNDTLYLADTAKSVKIIYRKDAFSRGEDILVKRAKGTANISFMFNTEISEVFGDESGVLGVITNSGEKIPCEGVFVAIGHEANTDYLSESVKRDDMGRLAQSDLPVGMFVCGDVQSGLKMQVATAVGAGCDAAMNAIAYLNSKS